MPTALTSAERLHRLGWIAGLPGLGLILLVATPLLAPRLEGRLGVKANVVARGAAESGIEPWLHVKIRGRDLVATGEAPDSAGREAALDRLVKMPGLRHVVGRIGLIEDASPFVWTATRTGPDRIDLSGNRPAEIGQSTLAAQLAPDLPPETRLTDQAKSARGAPPDFASASSYAVEQLKPLAPGATATIADTTLSFVGEAATVAGYEALRQAFANPPTGYTLGKVDILPAKIDDFRFAITHERGGGFVLSGYVVSELARAEVAALASDAAEGASVEDRMQTARGLAKGVDPSTLARFAFQVMALMQDGSVTFADSRLSVAGTALDGQAVAEVDTLIREALPAGVSSGPVTLAALPLSPYKLVLRRESDTVTVSGHLPDVAARERVLAALKPRFFRERIVDKSRLAQGAPADLVSAVETAIGPLAMLASGEIQITDRSLRLRGESLYRESARQAEMQLSRRMPAGWQAQAVVQGPSQIVDDAATCHASFQQAVGSRTLHFTAGSSSLKAEFYPILDALAVLAKRCPDARIEVTGHLDPAGAPPEVKPALDTAVESTASVEAASDGKTPAVKEQAKEAKGTTAKAGTTETGASKAKDGKAAPPKDKADAAKETVAPAKAGASKEKAGKAEAKVDAKQAPSTKPAPSAKPAAAAKAAPAAEPEPDLPRQRALAIVEYLLQAGLRIDRVAAAPAGRSVPGTLGVAFALLLPGEPQ